MAAFLMPLADITNKTVQSSNTKQFSQPRLSMESCGGLSPEESTRWSSPQPLSPHPMNHFSMPFEIVQPTIVRTYRHDPYSWKCIPDTEAQCSLLLAQRSQQISASRQQLLAQRQRSNQSPNPPQSPTSPSMTNMMLALSQMVSSLPNSQPTSPLMASGSFNPEMFLAALNPNTPMAGPKKNHRNSMDKGAQMGSRQPSAAPMHDDSEDVVPEAPAGPIVCRALIQFKCHQGEYSSTISLDRGQYVVVQGDRGIDIGVVNRVNTDSSKGYIERTGATAAVLRHATQPEVNYWASDLKADEASTLEYCRQRVIRHGLPMEVRHAEYQFDKKKLTFYYDAQARVDFVNLLKELYREYGCRIWMEKVRTHE